MLGSSELISFLTLKHTGSVPWRLPWFWEQFTTPLSGFDKASHLTTRDLKEHHEILKMSEDIHFLNWSL